MTDNIQKGDLVKFVCPEIFSERKPKQAPGVVMCVHKSEFAGVMGKSLAKVYWQNKIITNEWFCYLEKISS